MTSRGRAKHELLDSTAVQVPVPGEGLLSRTSASAKRFVEATGSPKEPAASDDLSDELSFRPGDYEARGLPNAWRSAAGDGSTLRSRENARLGRTLLFAEAT